MTRKKATKRTRTKPQSTKSSRSSDATRTKRSTLAVTCTRAEVFTSSNSTIPILFGAQKLSTIEFITANNHITISSLKQKLHSLLNIYINNKYITYSIQLSNRSPFDYFYIMILTKTKKKVLYFFHFYPILFFMNRLFIINKNSTIWIDCVYSNWWWNKILFITIRRFIFFFLSFSNLWIKFDLLLSSINFCFCLSLRRKEIYYCFASSNVFDRSLIISLFYILNRPFISSIRIFTSF